MQPKPKKAKRVDLAPWWAYVLGVSLSMLLLIALTPEGWTKRLILILDTSTWILFVMSNEHDKVMYDYLPWSLLVLYGVILVTLFLLP